MEVESIKDGRREASDGESSGEKPSMRKREGKKAKVKSTEIARESGGSRGVAARRAQDEVPSSDKESEKVPGKRDS